MPMLEPPHESHQEFNFAGPYGENGFLEDYTVRVRGEQIGNVVLVTRNAAGQTEPRSRSFVPLLDTRAFVPLLDTRTRGSLVNAGSRGFARESRSRMPHASPVTALSSARSGRDAGRLQAARTRSRAADRCACRAAGCLASLATRTSLDSAQN
jgi:hypothetical protein